MRAPVHARRDRQTEKRTAYAADERKGCQAATSRLESTRSSAVTERLSNPPIRRSAYPVFASCSVRRARVRDVLAPTRPADRRRMRREPEVVGARQHWADRGDGAGGERTPHLLTARRRQGRSSACLVWLACLCQAAAAPTPASLLAVSHGHLHYIQLQPALPMVAACITYGCRPPPPRRPPAASHGQRAMNASGTRQP